MADGNITVDVDVLNMDVAIAMKDALSNLIDAASNYVKPRRTADSRQLLLAALDHARASLSAAAPAQPAECGNTPYDEGPFTIVEEQAQPVAQPAEPLTDEQINASLLAKGWTLQNCKICGESACAYVSPKQPAPDCRTCANVVACMEVIGEITYCTNGDQYQPAPAVVLWRTE